MAKNNITLQEMFSAIVEELNETGRWGTAHIYEASATAFSTFMKDDSLPLCRLTPTLLKKYENHLRQRNCSWNTVSTYIKSIRSIYNRAVDMKLVRYTPRLFEHVYTGTRADRKKALGPTDIGSLLQQTERSALYAATQPLNESQQRTLLLFNLMFMLRGIPFVDLAYLHKSDLQGNVLTYRRKKTGRPLTVLLPPEAMQMVEQLSDRNPHSPYLFPILSSNADSRTLYRQYQSALREFNHQLATLRKNIGLTAPLSSYTARHTWATMAYHCEIHPGIISEAMGHSSITVTETYLKPFNNKKIDEANRTVIDFVKNLGKR